MIQSLRQAWQAVRAQALIVEDPGMDSICHQGHQVACRVGSTLAALGSTMESLEHLNIEMLIMTQLMAPERARCAECVRLQSQR